MPVIPVDGVVDKKRIIRKKWRAEEEERHKATPTHPRQKIELFPSFLPKKESKFSPSLNLFGIGLISHNLVTLFFFTEVEKDDTV
jgi:hypothetical protein